VSGEKKYSSRGPIDYSSGSFVVPMGTTEPPEEKWIDPRKPISCITVPEVQSSAKPRKSPQKANETIIRIPDEENTKSPDCTSRAQLSETQSLLTTNETDNMVLNPDEIFRNSQLIALPKDIIENDPNQDDYVFSTPRTLMMTDEMVFSNLSPEKSNDLSPIMVALPSQEDICTPKIPSQKLIHTTYPYLKEGPFEPPDRTQQEDETLGITQEPDVELKR